MALRTFMIDTGKITNLGVQILDVKDYGAIGDGVSRPLQEGYSTLSAAQAVYPAAESLDDELDWAAIQKLINLCAITYRTTYLPAGIFVINKPVTMPGWCNLFGEGAYCTVLKNTAITPGIRVLGDKTSMSNLQVQGNATDAYGVNGTTGDGILLDGTNSGCSYVNIDNVYCYRNGGSGIRLYGGNWMHNFTRCTCNENLYDGIKTDGDDGYNIYSGQKNMINIDKCTTASNGRNGVTALGTIINVHNGCTIESNLGAGVSIDCHDSTAWNGSALIRNVGSKNINIIGNYFEHNGHGSVYIRGGTYDGPIYSQHFCIRIEGNYNLQSSDRFTDGYSAVMGGTMENTSTVIRNLICRDNWIDCNYLGSNKAVNFNNFLDKYSEVNPDIVEFAAYYTGLGTARTIT